MAVDVEFHKGTLESQVAQAVAEGFKQGIKLGTSANGKLLESLNKRLSYNMNKDAMIDWNSVSKEKRILEPSKVALDKWIAVSQSIGKAMAPLRYGGKWKKNLIVQPMVVPPMAIKKMTSAPAMTSQPTLSQLIKAIPNPPSASSTQSTQSTLLSQPLPALGKTGSGKGKKKGSIPPLIDELIKQEYRAKKANYSAGLNKGWVSEQDFAMLNAMAREAYAGRYKQYNKIRKDPTLVAAFTDELKDKAYQYIESRMAQDPDRLRANKLGDYGTREKYMAEARLERDVGNRLAKAMYSKALAEKNPNAGLDYSQQLGRIAERFSERIRAFNMNMDGSADGLARMNNDLVAMRKNTGTASDAIARLTAKTSSVSAVSTKGKRGFYELAEIEKRSRYQAIDALFKQHQISAKTAAMQKAVAADKYEERIAAWRTGSKKSRREVRENMIKMIGLNNDQIAKYTPQSDQGGWRRDPWYKFSGMTAWVRERDPYTGKQMKSAVSEFGRGVNKLVHGFAKWVETIWLVRYGIRNMFAPLFEMIPRLIRSADNYTRLRNTYNVAMPGSMTQDTGSFEQWYGSSFQKAHALRMKASTWREMMMNAAPIFATAHFGEDATVNGVKYKKGQQIVTSMRQLEKIMTNLMRMQRISGSSDYEFQHAMMQVIQMISKGKGGIQDIKPMLESGGHMGEIFAQYAFRAHTGDLFKMSEEGQLKGETILRNLLSDDVTEDLAQRHKRTHRTWEEVGNELANKAGEWITPLIKESAAQSEYGIGDRVIALAERIFSPETQGALMGLLEYFTEWIYTNFERLMEQIPRFIAVTMHLTGIALRMLAGTLAIVGLIKGVVAICVTIADGLVTLASSIVDALNPVHWGKWIVGERSQNPLADAYDDFARDHDWTKGAWMSTAATFEDMATMFGQANNWDAFGQSITGGMFNIQGMTAAHQKYLDAVKKQEDERLPLMATGLSPLSNLDKNVEDIKKSSRQATATQLAILKQVVGTRVINRVTHVAPNVKTNIGTINSGAQIEELLRQLGDGMRHAVTTYTMTGA